MYKVFLVDDDELILKEIANTIPWMDNGFEVVGMESNSRKAIHIIQELQPDVVFCDLKMPTVDGHGFMKYIREKGIEVEFVMLSAYGTFEDACTFFKQDGFDYLLKPVQMEEVQLVLEKLANKLAVKYPPVRRNEDENMNEAFLEMVYYLRNHYWEKFTLDNLGKQFALSPGYICNLFSKYYNTTLTCFVTDIRMMNAEKLMKESNYNLKQIAIECGYSDYYYFNKVFKAHYGTAPSQYQKELL
jgi:YesN/AraC family two-component response regulator